MLWRRLLKLQFLHISRRFLIRIPHQRLPTYQLFQFLTLRVGFAFRNVSVSREKKTSRGLLLGVSNPLSLLFVLLGTKRAHHTHTHTRNPKLALQQQQPSFAPITHYNSSTKDRSFPSAYIKKEERMEERKKNIYTHMHTHRTKRSHCRLLLIRRRWDVAVWMRVCVCVSEREKGESVREREVRGASKRVGRSTRLPVGVLNGNYTWMNQFRCGGHYV